MHTSYGDMEVAIPRDRNDEYEPQLIKTPLLRTWKKRCFPIVREWHERPLEEVYAVVFMDALHYHVRNEGRIVKRVVYLLL